MPIKLFIEGADSAHLHNMRRKTSRIWRFPDQRDRVMTLSNWHWEVFDKEIAPYGVKSFIAETFDMARHEYELQQAGMGDPGDPELNFEGWIHLTAADYIRTFGGTAYADRCVNDNGY